MILNTIEKASRVVFAYLFLLGILMIAITVITMNSWGNHIKEYTNFLDALISVIFLQMGVTNFQELERYNVIWSFAYLFIYTIVI